MSKQKKCTKCKVTKDLSEFHQDARIQCGVTARCKECTKIDKKGRRVLPHRAKGVIVSCSKCLELKPRYTIGRNQCQECSLKHLKDRRWKPEAKARRKNSDLIYQYNITSETYAQMLEGQGGVCLGCEDPPEPGKLLCVDHDHDCCPGKKSCGKCVRGLLCGPCNLLEAKIRKALHAAARLVAYILCDQTLNEEDYKALLEANELMLETAHQAHQRYIEQTRFSTLHKEPTGSPSGDQKAAG
jgi:hypothetical protein